MNKFENLSFTVRNVRGISLDKALQLWKTMYPSFAEFHKSVIIYDSLAEFGDYASTVWNKIEPVTVNEAFEQVNTEERRLYFDAIGISKIFESLNPELINEVSLALNNQRWDKDGKPYLQTGIDKYSLYKINGQRLFGDVANTWQVSRSSVYAVRCACTTTNREYWLYVSPQVGEKGSAIGAIAWTCRIGITNPKAIYRQGDIFVIEANVDSKECQPYHLDSDTYLKLIISQT